MNITRENIDSLNAIIKVKVGPEDYQSKVETTLKDYTKKIQMPGFRLGKVPAQLVRKMHGKTILAEALNKLINESLQNYIKDNNIELLGNPLPAVNDDNKIDFDAQTEFEFKYDLGLTPQFKVDLSSKDSFTYHVIKADETLLDKYITDIAKRYGKIVHPEQAEKDDLINGDFVELDANNNIVAGGVFKNGSIFTERLKNETLKKQFLGLKVGDKLTVDGATLAEDIEHFTGVTGVPADKLATLKFQFTVKDINRLEPCEITQELFDKVLGPDKVNGIEEFKTALRTEIEKGFEQDSERKFKTDIVKVLVDKAQINLPDSFLKRWIAAVNEKPVTPEQLEAEYPTYAEQLKWQLIENKLLKENEIKVTADEAIAFVKEIITAQFQRYGRTDVQDEELTQTAQSVLAKEDEAKRVYEQLYDKKLMNLFKTKFNVSNKEVTYEEFTKN